MNTHNIRNASQNTSRTASFTLAHSHSQSLSSSTPATLAGLSDQQKRMMEEKRKAALAKKVSQSQGTAQQPVNLPTELKKVNSSSVFYKPAPFGTSKIVKGACV